ncbi:MAG: hypothetical protein ACRD4O_00890 [Bryobacteraceae bacterium]
MNAELPVRVWLTVADHFEPLGMGASDEDARSRVARWRTQWPSIAVKHADSTGRGPQYTFFYPEEEYRAWLLDPLAELADAAVADVEIHLHHDGEGEQNFVDRIGRFKETLRSRHGLLRQRDGKIPFGFIHGNWALDNSRPDGRWCGLNNEIALLRDLDCYADFTMPSGNSDTQARTVNEIYWAVDDSQSPKSYDRGIRVQPGGGCQGDLLIVPGPLGIRWRGRIVPRLDSGELAGYDPPSDYRFKRWLDCAPRLGNDIFIKLFSHGCQDRNSFALLEHRGLDSLFGSAERICESRGYALHYVSAWEMFQAIEAITGRAAAKVTSERSALVR